MQKKLLTKLLMATILSTIISTGVAFAETNAEDIDKINHQIVEEQQQTIINKEKQDVITVKGLSRYDIRHDNRPEKKGETRKSLWRTRLEPTINIGNGWKIKNRMDYEQNYKAKGDDKSHFYNRMLYLQGPAFGGIISLGKVDYVDFANMDIAYGMIFDDYIK